MDNGDVARKHGLSLKMRDARRAKQLSQTEVAHLLGVSLRTVQMIERDDQLAEQWLERVNIALKLSLR